MAVIPLVTVATANGLRRLRTPAEPYPIDRVAELKAFARDLAASMHAHGGVGLAANQVGRPERVAVIAHVDGDFAIVNPRILRRSLLRETEEEGCLSLPQVFGAVRRARSISVEYWTIEGQRVRRRATGLLARVFQHEIDHLDGFLFVDRTRRVTHGSVPESVHATRPASR